MDPNSVRFNAYQAHIQADKDSFINDIDLWSGKLGDPLIKHHIAQFRQLCDQAISRLTEEYTAEIPPADQKLTFQSIIVGALISQWGLLRRVAEQRLDNHPYQRVLTQLEDQAAEYYYRLRKALGELTGKWIGKSSPLLYLGDIAEVTVFTPDAPSVLSVPFGAASLSAGVSHDSLKLASDFSRSTLPHEVAHAVMNQLPDFISEIEFKYLSQQIPDLQRQELRQVIRGWLNEIAADLVGTALGGSEFALNASRIMVLPDEAVGMTDERHPVPVIRPYIHLAALEHLRSKEHSEVQNLRAQVEKSTTDKLGARFEWCPDLTVVNLETVKDEMLQAVDAIWDMPLKALGGKSLGAILEACYRDSSGAEYVSQAERFPPWGSDSGGPDQKFVLRLVGSVRPEHAVPVTFPLGICQILHLPWC